MGFSGATTIVYNGSPMYPDAKQLLRICEKYAVTYFGTSPRYLLELEMSKTIPQDEFDLKSLRIVYTTGATLSVSVNECLSLPHDILIDD